MVQHTSFLRMPPFPGQHDFAEPASSGLVHAGLTSQEIAALVEQLAVARVGGAFWGEQAELPKGRDIILAPSSPEEAKNLSAQASAGGYAERCVWIGHWATGDNLPHLPNTLDPWHLVDQASRVEAGENHDMALVAAIKGKPLRLQGASAPTGSESEAASPPFWLEQQFRALPAYRSPFTGEPMPLSEVIDVLAEWRRIIDDNRSIVAACGMAWWKRNEIRRFLWSPHRRLHMVMYPARGLAAAKRAGGALAIWPSRVSPALIAAAQKQAVPLIRVEDGFVRSVGLGTSLVPPSSIVVDRSGIHFDPSGPSDLETILAKTEFSARLLARAESLRRTIVAAGISKYAKGGTATVPARTADRKLILVPGQVEDDMSVIHGGGGLRSNLELLRRARALEPDAEIWFRPHPDVDSGHRKGAVPDEDVLAIADRIVREPGMAALLDCVDAVHVLTSLTGFEALLRGKKVTCHGTPFYAGWGLTRDLASVPDRRGRQLTLDMLTAGVLILYPRYLDPITGLPCPPEVLVQRMAQGKAPNRLSWVAPLRRWQGQLVAKFR